MPELEKFTPVSQPFSNDHPISQQTTNFLNRMPPESAGVHMLTAMVS